MERENLKYISEQILLHVRNISYDDTILFMGFKIDMYRNIERFLSPESLEYYYENVRILKNVEIKKQKEIIPTVEYIKRLRAELAHLIETLNPKENEKNFEIDKIEIMINIVTLLNPYQYINNIQALSNKEHQKRLTIPHGRW